MRKMKTRTLRKNKLMIKFLEELMYYLQVWLLVFALAGSPPAGATKGVKPRLKIFVNGIFYMAVY